MAALHKLLFFIVFIVATIAVVGCGNKSDTLVAPPSSGTVVVMGDVTMIEDLVPVDGGVTIDVDLESGDSERLLFGSLFTDPPPSQDKINLYDVVRRVELGDRVRAKGTRTEAGIELEDLAILSGRP